MLPKKLVPRLSLPLQPMYPLATCPFRICTHMGTYSDQDSIKAIFLFISPLSPQACSSMPLGGSPFLTHHAADGIKFYQGCSRREILNTNFLVA